MKKIYFLDRLGWPVETLMGRPILNVIRRIIHTRKITTQWKPPEWLTEMGVDCDYIEENDHV